MSLRRCTEQGPQTLQEYYKEILGENEQEGMLPILALLPSHLDGKTIFGLTSHDELYLLSEDDHMTPWWVSIKAIPFGGYEISYLYPILEAPWKEARVKGCFDTVDETIQKTLLALRLSGGWT